MTGTSTSKSCYSWSCDNRCLYYKGIPACYKSQGILISNANLQNRLLPYFDKLDICSYVYRDNLNSFEEKLSRVFARFYLCAVNAEWPDEIILQLLKSFNCKFENKYLEYCRKLDSTKFRDVTKKHLKRAMEKPVIYTKELDGLWYREVPTNMASSIHDGIASVF